MTGADVSFSGDSAFAYAENGGTVVCDPADFVNIGNTVYIRCTFGEGITETIGWAGQSGSQLIIQDSPTCENFADWTNGNGGQSKYQRR